VLDVSRSMLAGQPSRQELAKRALRNLAGTLTETGGPRLALVIFAAHARLAFPLTTDYDHLLDALERIDADDLPPNMRPRSDEGNASGTRIGAGLRLAVQTLDPKSGGDILLLSDGDDPAGDEEWLQGAEEARKRHIPVHTICLGNPTEASPIPSAGGVVKFGGQAVLTRVDEKTLKEIARRTQGSYVPAFLENLPLGKLLPSILSQAPPGSDDALDQSLPIWQPRYVWFLAPSLILLALAFLGSDRRSIYLPPPPRVAFLFVTMFMVSAAPPPDAMTFVRLGNEAYDRGEDEAALKFFEQAEDTTDDPGLVSFNKAAVLYRLERYGDAAQHYQRCLDDGTIPANRKARAYFQLGNAYVRQAKGSQRGPLEKAIDAYRLCLLMKETDGDLRTDARHNLELARLLWLKALPQPEDFAQEHPPFPNIGKIKEPEVKKDIAAAKQGHQVEANSAESGSEESNDTAHGAAAQKSKKSQTGPITVLPDTSTLVPLSPEETEALLANISQRLLQDQRHYRRHAVTVPDHIKDW
jgi:tetratricopeptide (TPR) repeat protein